METFYKYFLLVALIKITIFLTSKKMTYLNSWLLDSAENTLEDFNPSSKNYKLALESLIYRFGNDQVLLSALMKNLINKLKIIN